MIKYLVYTSKKSKILQMKILNSFISQRFKLLAITAISILSFSYNIHAQGDATKGEVLFKANCGACHFPHKDMTGPALQGARQRWIDNSSEENFYAWIKNSGAVIASGVLPEAADMMSVENAQIRVAILGGLGTSHLSGYVRWIAHTTSAQLERDSDLGDMVPRPLLSAAL